MPLPPNAIRTVLALILLVGTCGWIAYSATYGDGIHLFSLNFSDDDDDDKDSVSASTASTREDRDIGDAHAIAIDAPVKAVITIGGEPKLTVTGPDDATSHLTTRVEHGTLRIDTSGHMKRDEIVVTINLPHLDALTIDNGKATVSGLDGGSLKLALEGSSELAATGRLEFAKIQMDGAGKLDIGNLETRTMALEVNGTGKADVRATELLKVEINGSGAVTYAGTPQHLEKAVNGVGTVRQAT